MFPTSNYLWTCPLRNHQQHGHRDPEVTTNSDNRRCPECDTEMRGNFIIKDDPVYPQHDHKD